MAFLRSGFRVSAMWLGFIGFNSEWILVKK